MNKPLESSRDEVCGAVKRATEAVSPFCSRISVVIKADTRPGYKGEPDGKIKRLERAIQHAGG